MQKKTDNSRQRCRFRCRLAAIGILMLGGLIVTLWQPSFFPELLEQGREIAGKPWAAVTLILLLAALLALAMPGSLIILIVAPLYPPAVATIILTTGGVIGSWGAYAVARWAGAAGPATGNRPVMLLLASRGDFLTQLGLRIMPAFPHSLVNYGAGFLGLPLHTFLAAAALGLAIKWYVYSAAIHALAAAGNEVIIRPLAPRTAAPLLLLAGLFIAGAFFRHWLRHGRKDRS